MKKITHFLCLAMALLGVQSVSALTPPTTAAPVPSHNEEANAVRSWYNGAKKYTDIEWFSPTWGGGQVEPNFSEAGDDGECMLLYRMGYIALQHDVVNLAGDPEKEDAQYFHVDFYANENTDFRIGLQSWGSGEHYFPAIQYTTPGQWYSVDYPMQLIIDDGLGDPKETVVLRIGNSLEGEDFHYANEIYVDNIYAFTGEPTHLYDPSGITKVAKGDFKLSQTVVREELSFSSEAAVQSIRIFNVTGQQVKLVQTLGNKVNVADLSAGNYIVKVQLENGASVNTKFIKL
ncbi:hypothetical protein FACS189463_2730 [Bacteroidia bacterium]|nr:hypothetical protein FACS189463_2730 [Bacteroidia bacterium]